MSIVPDNSNIPQNDIGDYLGPESLAILAEACSGFDKALQIQAHNAGLCRGGAGMELRARMGYAAVRDGQGGNAFHGRAGHKKGD